jgi:hypothetical protein
MVVHRQFALHNTFLFNICFSLLLRHKEICFNETLVKMFYCDQIKLMELSLVTPLF